MLFYWHFQLDVFENVSLTRLTNILFMCFNNKKINLYRIKFYNTDFVSDIQRYLIIIKRKNKCIQISIVI